MSCIAAVTLGVGHHRNEGVKQALFTFAVVGPGVFNAGYTGCLTSSALAATATARHADDGDRITDRRGHGRLGVDLQNHQPGGGSEDEGDHIGTWVRAA